MNTGSKRKAAKACSSPRATSFPLAPLDVLARDAAPRWKDASSYNAGERGTIEPSAWTLDLASGVRVSVHRWRGMSGWYVTCAALRVDTERLESESGMAARQEALVILRRRAQEVSAALTVEPKEPKEPT